MKELEFEIKVQNRTLKQIKRQGRAALYALYGPGNELYGFEVILIKVHPAEIIQGRPYPEREGYPANEDWGRLAWSYGRNDEKVALKKFEGLAIEHPVSLAETDLVAG